MTLSTQIEEAHVQLDRLGVPSTKTTEGEKTKLSVPQRLAWLAGDEGTEEDKQEAKVKVTYGKVRGPILDAIMGPIVSLAKPWSKLSEQQQRDLLASIRSRLDAGLDRAVRTIVNADLPTITAKLGDFTVKSDVIVGKFEAARAQDYIEDLGMHGLRPIHIVLADPRLLDDGSYAAETKAQPDQADVEDQLFDGTETDLADAGDETEIEADATEATDQTKEKED